MGSKAVVIAIALAVSSSAALADGNSNVVVVNSALVATQPYVTQGVEVQKGNTWYLGSEPGLTAQMQPGGVRYTYKPQAAPESAQRVADTAGQGASTGAASKAVSLLGQGADKMIEKPQPRKAKPNNAKTQARVATLENEIRYELEHLPPLPKSTCGSIYYRVMPGDSLALIAKRLLRDPSKWYSIYTANRKVIGSNPNALEVGEVLAIPQVLN